MSTHADGCPCLVWEKHHGPCDDLADCSICTCERCEHCGEFIPTDSGECPWGCYAEEEPDPAGGYLVPREFLRDRWVEVTPWWLRPLVWLGAIGPVLEHEPGILTLMARPVGCRFPTDCSHPHCACSELPDPTATEEWEVPETPLHDFQEALAAFVDALTEALRIPQALDWLGERLDAIRRW